MKTIKISAFILMIAILYSCGGSTEESSQSSNQSQATASEKTTDPASYDPKRGEGKYTAETLSISGQLDQSKAKEGENISGVKCTSCHKITSEKLVGPGWQDVTKRRTPEWIMNFITNPDPMIDKDPEAQAMLELCLVRMPNQNLTDDEARNILEYMRKIDGVK